jgi:Flp pilus assembly protein protease CpaA
MLQFEVVVLFCMAVIWILFATIQDIRTREIANWLNLSLAVFALGFRFFYSFFESGNMGFFYQGVIGLVIFVVLGNLFYYGKMFAGGDAKLMMALGAVLPISSSFIVNLKFFLLFLTAFLVVGAVYGLLVSLFFGVVNFARFRKEFGVQLKKFKKFTIVFLALAILFLLLGFRIEGLFYAGLFFFIIPYFYLYVKAVDEACMVKWIKPSKLTVGDWLYENTKVGRKVIKATWDGVSEEEIKLLNKLPKVLVRYGVQFAPVFLIGFVVTYLIQWFGWFGF